MHQVRGGTHGLHLGQPGGYRAQPPKALESAGVLCFALASPARRSHLVVPQELRGLGAPECAGHRQRAQEGAGSSHRLESDAAGGAPDGPACAWSHADRPDPPGPERPERGFGVSWCLYRPFAGSGGADGELLSPLSPPAAPTPHIPPTSQNQPKSGFITRLLATSSPPL